MEAEEAVQRLSNLVHDKEKNRLNYVQESAIRGSWTGLSCQEIYNSYKINRYCGFDHFQKNICGDLWQLLTKVLGEKVTKNNLNGVVEAAARRGVLPRVFPQPKQDERETPAETQFSEGSEPLNFAFYVERVPYEAQFYAEMMQPGGLVRIKAPQQMGKTLFMEKLRSKLADEGFRTVSLSFRLADRDTHFTNLDKFLRWFCTNVTRQMGLPSQLDDYWDKENLGSKMSCTAYFEEYLLEQADTPLVLCLDDVDWIFPHTEISKEFFAMVRSWYDRGSSCRDIFIRLRVVLIHSTQDYIRLDIERSPFNVGICIELSDFSQEQVQDLVRQHGLDWDPPKVEQLMKMLGGYPYLVQRALSHLKNHQDITLDEFLETASEQGGIYSNYLLPLLTDLQKHSELASAFKTVVMATESVQLEPLEAYKLHSIGLVEWQGNEVKLRCNLFRQYFCTCLGDS